MRVPGVVVSVLLFSSFTWAGNNGVLVADTSSQLIQNERADADNLSRMRDVSMIQKFARSGYLVRVPVETDTYYLHDIPSSFRYCRPWTKLFLDRLSRQYEARFHEPLRITSLVRTVDRQARLARRNGNAADASGPTASSHLTGATLDISKHSMSPAGQAWLRDVLYSLRQAGYLYAIEEFEQPVFHVMVFEHYTDYVERVTHRSRQHEVKTAEEKQHPAEEESAGGGS